MKRKSVYTNNKEIYEKFNMLNFSPEIVLTTVKPYQLTKILNNINSKNKVLTSEKIGEYFIIRRVGNINYNVHFTKK